MVLRSCENEPSGSHERDSRAGPMLAKSLAFVGGLLNIATISATNYHSRESRFVSRFAPRQSGNIVRSLPVQGRRRQWKILLSESQIESAFQRLAFGLRQFVNIKRQSAAECADGRESLVRAMLNPGLYPSYPEEIVHKEIHILHVFLAGELAYKIKKPVRFRSSISQLWRKCFAECRGGSRTSRTSGVQHTCGRRYQNLSAGVLLTVHSLSSPRTAVRSDFFSL